MNKPGLYLKIFSFLTTVFILNGCVFIEVLFENKKKVDCPRYFNAWNAKSDKKSKKKKKNDPALDPKAGTVVTSSGDSVAFEMVYVPRNQYGLVDKKKPKIHKKNPDPRMGFKPNQPEKNQPKRKTLDPAKHN